MAPVAWRISGRRSITSAEGLTQLELQQLRIAGQRFDGVDRPPELRFVELTPADGEDEDRGCFASTGFLSVSAVYDGDRHLYDLWQIDPDAACLFVAGTTEQVAGRCQSTWMTPDLMHPYQHAAALDQAMNDAGIW